MTRTASKLTGGSMAQNYITKAYSIEPVHVATIAQVAKDHGESSDSAALRFIIDKFVEYEMQSNGNGNGHVPNQPLAAPRE